MLAQWLPMPVLELCIIPLLLAACAAGGWLMLAPWLATTSKDTVERITLYALAGFGATSFVGVAWAFVGLFKLWTLIPTLAALALGVRYALKHYRPVAAQTSPAGSITPVFVQVIVGLLLVGASWLYARPAESVLLTDDSAVYTIGGIVLARDGTLYYEPDEVYLFELAESASPEDAALDYLYQFSFAQTYTPVLTRHMGPFYRYPSGPNARIEIGFLALPKVWTALCVWAGGIPLSSYSVAFLGVLGLALFYCFVRRCTNWATALAAMLVLGSSFTQTWYARFPLSEMPTQVVILGALLLVELVRRSTDSVQARILGIWSGCVLGLLGCLRFESPLILAMILPLVWATLKTRPVLRQAGRYLAIASLATWGICFAGSVVTTPFYFLTRSINLMSPRVVQVLSAALAICGTAACSARWRLGSWRLLWNRLSILAPRWMIRSVAVGLAIWLLHVLSVIVGLDKRESLAGWLVLYWGQLPFLMVALSSLAFCATCLRRPDRTAHLVPLVGLCTAFLLIYSINPMVAISHPWAIRRTVAYIAPALAFGIASIPYWVKSCSKRAKLAIRSTLLTFEAGAWVAWALCLFVVAWASTPFLLHRERVGSLDGLLALDGILPRDAVVLLDDGARARQYGPFLELVLGHPTYPLRSSAAHAAEPQVVDVLLRSVLAQGRPACYLHDDGTAPWPLPAWQLVSRGGADLAFPAVGTTSHAPPGGQDIVEHQFLLDVYDVLPAKDASVWEQQTLCEIPVGPGSFPYLQDGYYDIERQDADYFRWTDGELALGLPWPGADNVITSICIALDQSAWRPEGEDPVQITVQFEGQPASVVKQPQSADRQTIYAWSSDIVQDDTSTLDIVISSNSWTPPNGGETTGVSRPLGIMLYGAQVVVDQPCQCDSSGLYPEETDPLGHPYHWTMERSTIAYSWPGAQDEPLGTVVLDLSAYRSPKAEAAIVSVTVEGNAVYGGALDPSGALQTIALPTDGILNEGASTLDITIEASTWSPAETDGGTDTRALGVMLYDVRHDE